MRFYISDLHPKTFLAITRKCKQTACETDTTVKEIITPVLEKIFGCFWCLFEAKKRASFKKHIVYNVAENFRGRKLFKKTLANSASDVSKLSRCHTCKCKHKRL